MAQKKEIPLSLQTSVTSLIDPPRKVPGLLHSRPLFRMVPNLHVVQGTPATVRVPRAQTLPTSCVLFTGFHGDPGDLVERGRSTVRSNSDTSLAYNLPTPALSLLLEETLGGGGNRWSRCSHLSPGTGRYGQAECVSQWQAEASRPPRAGS